MKLSKIPLSTAIWANVYESLIKDGVIFPPKFKGIGACYGGLVAVKEVLEDYKISDFPPPHRE